LGDLGVHLIDMAELLAGKIQSVCGSIDIIVKERQKLDSDEWATVDTDDYCSFICNIENNIKGNFVISRCAKGRGNSVKFDIYGTKGLICFNMNNPNVLDFYSEISDLSGDKLQTIDVPQEFHTTQEAEFINMLCGKDGEELITGGKDNLDLFAEDRYILGFRLAAARAATGDKEGAYEAIEASIGIIEKIAALPEGAELTFGSPTLGRITGKLKKSNINGYICQGFLFYDGEEKLDGKLVTDCLEMKVHILAERKGWEWFDSIRDEERYKALTERLKKAVK
jgi:hypothetical protein